MLGSNPSADSVASTDPTGMPRHPPPTLYSGHKPYRERHQSAKSWGCGGKAPARIRSRRRKLLSEAGRALIMRDSAIWHSLRELVSCPEVWLAQCLCESNESLPYRKLVESAKAEEQRIRIRTSQSASIDGENLNTLGRRQLFRPS